MKKLTKEELKTALEKLPTELTKEELSFIFDCLSFQIKEYYSGVHNISFEIHFERTFIIRVQYPKEKGTMSFNNEFVNFGEGTHGIATGRAKDTLELVNLFINMFYDNLLASANYGVGYDEEESMFDSPEEAKEYFEFIRNLIKEG